LGAGVNDAPALMLASGHGFRHRHCHESADVVLSGSDLPKLVEPLSTARHSRRSILENFVATFIVDSIGVGLAAFGFFSALLAAFIHPFEPAFILNSATLLPSAWFANLWKISHARLK
jgi:P-type Cu+ transporter